jgi:hypothetical protein
MADALPGPGTGAGVRAPTGTFTRSGNGRECRDRARGLRHANPAGAAG